MPTMRFWPGFCPGQHWGSLQRFPRPLAGKGGGGPRNGPTPESGGPGKERGGREGEERGKGKIVATRCQILRLKCEDALYALNILTDLLTSVVL